MKRLFYAVIIVFVISAVLQGCASKDRAGDDPHPSEALETSAPESGITKAMAYEGVFNYCRSEFDWNIEEDDPSVMSVQLGEESETEYQLIFRSYTGAYVYFYVDKSNGTARMVEYVPALDSEKEAGSFDLFDYIKKPE